MTSTAPALQLSVIARGGCIQLASVLQRASASCNRMFPELLSSAGIANLTEMIRGSLWTFRPQRRRMAVRYLKGVSVVCVMSALSALPASAQQGPFRFQEATIASIHAALAAGQLTCTQLIKLYLDRIAAYDMQGPALHAIITVNPKAMEIAAEMDRSYQANPASAGTLHCIPVILKDNFNTFDLPTSGGNVGMKTSQPPNDAFTVARMRKAGALILAKANMSEFARGGMSNSSLGGQVRNPYDLERTPGGSSGGPGAAIAANFAVLSTGSDTGQSIRSPASANNLVGIRPTLGLASRAGVIPNSLTQDEIDPIRRTVTDAARLLSLAFQLSASNHDPAYFQQRVCRSIIGDGLGVGQSPTPIHMRTFYEKFTSLISMDTISISRIGRRSGPRV
jgi:Amidase